MKKSRILKVLVVLFFPVFLFQISNCNGDQSAQQKNTPPPTLSLICQQETSKIDGAPAHSVHLDFNGEKIKLANILACETFKKEDYAQHQMPENTIQAVGGWWAGSGEYFYLAPNADGSFGVYYGQMYEEKETKLYDYTELVRIKKDELGKWIARPKHDLKSLVGTYTLGGHDNSWMLVVKPDGEKIKATYYEIDGMLPPTDFLKNNPIPAEGKSWSNFEVDLSDMVIESDIGGGQLEVIFGRERITFFEVGSHLENQLRLTKDPALGFLTEK